MQNVRNKIYKREDHYGQKGMKDLGSYLKRRRLELKQNQESVAYGICSVSYLSKLENNKIKCNQMIVQELMEKLEVNPLEYDISLHDKTYLKDMIHAYYFYETDDIEQIYQKVKTIDHSLTVNITKLIYFTMIEDDERTKCIHALEQVVTNMNDLDLQSFLVFAGIAYQQLKKLPLAYEMFELSLHVQQENIKLRAMASDHLFEVTQMLHKRNTSFKNYLEAKRLYQGHNNIKRLMYLQLKEAKCILYEDPKESQRILTSLDPSLFDQSHNEEYHITLTNAFKLLKENDKAVEQLSFIHQDSERYLEKLFLSYQLIEDHKKKTKIAEEISQFTISKEDLDIIISYRLISEKDLSKKKDYLKDIAIPYAKKVYNFDLLKELVKLMIEICMSTSRYKEATSYVQGYFREKERVHNYIDTKPTG